MVLGALGGAAAGLPLAGAIRFATDPGTDSVRQTILSATATAANGETYAGGPLGKFNEQLVRSLLAGVGIVEVSYRDQSKVAQGTASLVWPNLAQHPQAGLYLLTAGHALTFDGQRQLEEIAGISFFRPGIDAQPIVFNPGTFKTAVPKQAGEFKHDIGLVHVKPGIQNVGALRSKELVFSDWYTPQAREQLLVLGFPQEFTNLGQNGAKADAALATSVQPESDGLWQINVVDDHGGSGSPVMALVGDMPLIIGCVTSDVSNNAYVSYVTPLGGIYGLVEDTRY